MDQANVLAKAVGLAAVASEASVIERPLIVPRWEGSTALLIARAVFTNICGWGRGGVQCEGEWGRGGGREAKGVSHQGCPFLDSVDATSKSS